MGIEEKIQIVSESNHWIHGQRYSRKTSDSPWVSNGEYGKFIVAKERLWFANEPKKMLELIGVHVEKIRAAEIGNLFEGWLGGYYYLAAATMTSGDGTETAKWLMGAVAAHLNETSQSILDVGKIIPADYLGIFVKYLNENKFPRSFSKDVFAALLSKRVCFDVDQKRLSGEEVMNEIISDPRFKPVDDSAIDDLIAQTIAANPENAAKVKDQPKLVQWFVGQVLKQAKGKAPASDVLAKLKSHFGV